MYLNPVLHSVFVLHPGTYLLTMPRYLLTSIAWAVCRRGFVPLHLYRRKLSYTTTSFLQKDSGRKGDADQEAPLTEVAVSVLRRGQRESAASGSHGGLPLDES